MGYWIQNSRGKLEMISAGEIRQRITSGTLAADTPCVKLSFIQELNPFWKKPFQPLRTFAEFAALFDRLPATHALQASGVEVAVAVAYITAVLIPIAGIIVGAGLIANDKTRREGTTAVVLSLIMCGVYLFIYLAMLR
ncbi:MAG: hypothetical protein DME90_05285 [Verrucomicrobia bacterium]|nr:MAG: hypothetical protein DME90_05285 [Verrucomicrobiota bacterium]